MSLEPGSALGPYTIRSQLGQGGMGVVYLAHDPKLKRQVAIKLLPPDLTRDTIAKQRFLQEAQAASALDHPNICTIPEINETADGQLYLVMAHYAGETLKERSRVGRWRWTTPSTSPRRSGRGWPRRMARASCIGTSSRRICSSRRAARSRSSTSAWPSSRGRRASRRPAPRWARSSICRQSKRGARRSITGPTSGRWGWCSTRC